MISISEPLKPLVDYVEGLQQMVEESRENWDDFEHLDAYENRTKIACGYPGDHGPMDLLIPSTPLAMPASFNDKGAFVRGFTDLEFLCSYACYSNIRHLATDHPAAVAEQPAWVTFVMNHKKCLAKLDSTEPHTFPLAKCGQGALAWFKAWLWKYVKDDNFTRMHPRTKRPSTFSHVGKVLEFLGRLRKELNADAETLFTFLASNASAFLWSTDYSERCGHDERVWYCSREVFRHLFTIGNTDLIVQELQSREAERFKRKLWPHILLKHPDRRKPQAHVSFGSITAYDVSTSKESAVNISPALMCDGGGMLLPYKEGAERIKESCDDFADANWRDVVREFFDEEEGIDENVLDTFEAFLEGSFSEDMLRTLNDLEYEAEYYMPMMGEGGKTEAQEYWPCIRFCFGSDEYEAVAVDAHIEDVPEKVKTAYLYNAYGDWAKTSWLRDRGMLGPEDEVVSRGSWDPAQDLSDKMREDYAEWCWEADDDWGHAVGSYDGCASEREIDRSDTVLNWCYWRRS